MTQFLHAFMSIIYLYIYYYLKTTPPNKRRRPVGRAAPVIIISRLRPVRISKRAPGYKSPVTARLLSIAQSGAQKRNNMQTSKLWTVTAKRSTMRDFGNDA